MVYEWKGYNYKVKAQVVGEEIEKIEKEKGIVTPAEVVTRAKSKKNPMHSLFEWDDRKAAEAHRLHQARQMICALTIVDAEVSQSPVRAFVNIETKAPAKQGLFANIKKAMTDAESREVVLRNAYAELVAFRHKYESLSELTGIFEKIDELEGERWV